MMEVRSRWLTPQQTNALNMIGRAAGRAVRSNNTADQLDPFGRWPIYWKTIDNLMAMGLVMRVGRFYHLTIEGEAVVERTRKLR